MQDIEARKVDSPFQQVEVSASLSLPPSYIENVLDGVREVLDSQLFHYDDRLKGVLFGVHGVKLKMTEGAAGMVFEDQADIIYEIEYKAVVMRPVVGMELQGRVSHISLDHVTLLYASIFQVVIPSEQITQEYSYDHKMNVWRNEQDKEKDVWPGGFAAFRIEEIIEKDTMLEFSGSLL